MVAVAGSEELGRHGCHRRRRRRTVFFGDDRSPLAARARYALVRSSVRRPRAARATFAITAKSRNRLATATLFSNFATCRRSAESSCVVSISANRHITMRRAYMHSYSSLLLASSYVATGRVSAFMSAYPGVTRDIVTTPPAGLAMVRNRGLEIPEEGATPLRKCLQLDCHALHLIESLRKSVHSLTMYFLILPPN